MIAGLLIAFVVMMILEFINSLFFPLPQGLDWNDTAAIQAFTASLPWTAYILVLIGWILGSFGAGFVSTYLSGETKYRLAFLVGILLTLGGVANNAMLGHNVFFNIIGLPMFIVFTYLGHCYVLYANMKKPSGAVPAV